MHGTDRLHAIVTAVLVLALVVPSVACLAQAPRASPSQTQMMQQSDYKRRADEAKESRATERQMATVGTPVEESSRELDYVVLVILVASVIAMVMISRRSRARARLRR
jgi:hypothetical protein